MTLSHPAAVVPLRRLGLPMTAMVIGSVVPDVPLFLGWPDGYALTHSVAGVLTVDAAATMVLLAIWFTVARDALIDLSPAAVRSRLAPHARLTRRQWCLAPLAAVVGAATHVFWDAFTHTGGWGVGHVSWLQTEHGGLLGLKWAQYVSGVVGLIVVCWAVIAYLRVLPQIRPHGPPRVLTPIILQVVVAVAVLTGVVSATLNLRVGFHAMAFHGVVNSIIAFVIGVAFACTAWQVAARSQPN